MRISGACSTREGGIPTVREHRLYIGGGWRAGSGGTAEATSSLFIADNGNVGIGTTAPTHPLQMGGGAYCTGTQWVDVSSREAKQDIEDLSTETAEDTVAKLNPATFAYKAVPGEQHVGFIAEDVPGLVATADRKGMSPMDVVAVLTKVVQQQQGALARQQRLMEQQQVMIHQQGTALQELQEKVAQLERNR